MPQCNLCKITVPYTGNMMVDMEATLEHVRLFHPEEYGDGPNRWPDGSLVYIEDFVPEEFRPTQE